MSLGGWLTHASSGSVYDQGSLRGSRDSRYAFVSNVWRSVDTIEGDPRSSGPGWCSVTRRYSRFIGEMDEFAAVDAKKRCTTKNSSGLEFNQEVAE